MNNALKLQGEILGDSRGIEFKKTTKSSWSTKKLKSVSIYGKQLTVLGMPSNLQISQKVRQADRGGVKQAHDKHLV